MAVIKVGQNSQSYCFQAAWILTFFGAPITVKWTIRDSSKASFSTDIDKCIAFLVFQYDYIIIQVS